MAKDKRSSGPVSGWKKKKWFSITSCEPFKGEVIGETPATEPTSLVGRTIRVNLMHLTKSIRDQNVTITFLVNDVKGQTATTLIQKYEIVSTQVKRLTKRKRDKLNDSFLIETMDKFKVRIKPMIITKNCGKGTQKTDLRKNVVDQIKEKASKLQYTTLLNDIINFKFQKELVSKANKIFPVRNCEIRALKLEALPQQS